MTQEFIPSTVTVREIFANGDSASYEDSVAAFDRWLAAHDAQIRAEALTLTDKESNKLSEVIWNYVEDEDFDAWLAAHDAQMRAEALEFTNEERDLMLKSALDFTETDDAQEVDEMIAAIIGSVVEHRKEQK